MIRQESVIMKRSKLLFFITGCLIIVLLWLIVIISTCRKNISLTGGTDITDHVLVNGQPKDFLIDGKTLTSQSEDPWIIVDVKQLSAVSLIRVRISGEPGGVAQIFFAKEGEQFSEEKSTIMTMHSGVNDFALPKDSYSLLRFDLTNQPNQDIRLVSIALYETKPNDALQVIVASVAGLGLFAGLSAFCFPQTRRELLRKLAMLGVKASNTEVFSVSELIKWRKYTFIMIIITIISCLFAISGSGWGLPMRLHPDEWTIVDTAARMAKNRTFEPDIFNRPDHLLIQINMLIFSLLAYIKGIAIENVSELGMLLPLTSRIITGFFAIGSVIISYFIGKKHSKLTGVISAFVFAFFPKYVTHSHFATPDVPVTFFMLLFIYISLCYMRNPNIKNLTIMSFTTAAFIAIKYPGALLCVMIAISIITCSIIQRKYIRIVGHGVLSVVFVVFFLFVISPVLIIKYNDVVKALLFETGSVHPGADGLSWGGNLLFYVKEYLSNSGIILTLCFIFGCYSLFRKGKEGIVNVPLLYGLIFWICLSYLPVHWERWGLPMYVSPLLVSAIGIVDLLSMIKAKGLFRKKQIINICIIAVLCVSALNMIVSSYGNLLAFILPDTRVASIVYCEDNNINKNNTAYEGYSPLWPTGPKMITGEFEHVEGAYYLSNNRIENIILSSGMYARYKAESERYAGIVAFYDSLGADYIESKRFEPPAENRSIVEAVNLCYRVDEIVRTMDIGFVGSTLIFYKANESNYIKYPFSTPVYFDNERKSYDRYCINGLSTQEERGVWTNGTEAEFLFYLQDSDNDLSLEFTVTPLISDDLPSQIVEIVINDECIDTLYISETGEYNVIIPSCAVKDSKIRLQFLLHTATSPYELEINSDKRVLGLFFHDMSISELFDKT